MQIHSLNHSQPYDYVVYGASVGGILLALHYAAAGNTVLVLNPYGFPGGSVTESLSCLQQRPVAATPHARQLFGQLFANPYATVYEAEEGCVLNPEVIKIGLQHALEASAVALLFHVKARALAPAGPDGYATLSVIGKEGEFSVRARRVLDATDAGHLTRLVRRTGQLTGARLCVFTSPVPEAAAATMQALAGLQQAVRLPDGRYWLALGLPAAHPTFVETTANDMLDTLTAALAPLGARLQIVPAETQLLYQAAPAEPGEAFGSAADLLAGRSYAPHQWLQRAADLEAAAVAAQAARPVAQ
ncbi:FAD-dependent oxidoreductase [Hymenobacter aquaticus]|uniref:FAD-dependent oxidoreductase n=1 Tax=Hymenobacter aquaticus TaxID=1867101 RepID=A0A4Z0Q6V1_9BACT|nr:FAD-dependent oxidoreductase [Hymenobacter aquaticus]TGE25810.1 FAD-dependent oxidoreductase [Hymenobacter aquaticus]